MISEGFVVECKRKKKKEGRNNDRTMTDPINL